MEWRDEGLIVGVRRHGEHSAIVEAMTRQHGRHLGLVRGGRSARMTAALQPGNTIGLPIERDGDVPHVRLKQLNVANRRFAGVADRGLGRLNWAEIRRCPNGRNERISGHARLSGKASSPPHSRYASASTFATTTTCTSECMGAGSAASRRFSPSVKRSAKAAAAPASPALALSR